MLSFLARRLLQLLPLLLGISIMVFLLFQVIPGDPVEILLGVRGTPEMKERLSVEFGLDQPLAKRLVIFLGQLARGNLGTSFQYKKPVWEVIRAVLPQTLLLAGTAVILAALLGITVGIASAAWRQSWLDYLLTGLSLAAISVPVFWLGFQLQLYLGLRLGLFPISGGGGGINLILPTLALAPGSAGLFARLTRSTMLEVLNQDYIRTAKAKGINRLRVLQKHALKNAFIPIITVIGLSFGDLITGALLVEVIFARPGLGRLLVDAIKARDYPLIQGIVLLVALGYALVNLTVDLLYAYLNPQVRYD
ncbi:MAG: ABC transporter permease [Trueperaceae bacterium]|nr:ABC transporter permease [Trueperaceae bacterium]